MSPSIGKAEKFHGLAKQLKTLRLLRAYDRRFSVDGGSLSSTFIGLGNPHHLPLNGSSIRQPPTAGAHPLGRPRLHRTPIGEGDFTEVPLAQLIGFIPLKN